MLPKHALYRLSYTEKNAEHAGFEPASRLRNHGLANRRLEPLGQCSKKGSGYGFRCRPIVAAGFREGQHRWSSLGLVGLQERESNPRRSGL